MKTHMSIRCMIAAVSAFAAIGSTHADVSERVGYAYDTQTGAFLYSETHREA